MYRRVSDDFDKELLFVRTAFANRMRPCVRTLMMPRVERERRHASHVSLVAHHRAVRDYLRSHRRPNGFPPVGDRLVEVMREFYASDAGAPWREQGQFFIDIRSAA